MRKFILILTIFILVGIGLTCSKSTEPQEQIETPQRTPAQLTASEKELVSSANDFSFKLFQSVTQSEDPGKNIFISPLSVSYALGMTENGAVGPTQQAMMSTLEQSGMTMTDVNEAYYNLLQILEHADTTVIFSLANSIWYRQDKVVIEAFKETCRRYFLAKVTEMNFPNAVDTVNKWVDDNTNGKIKKILDSIDPNIAMILLNAIYFKGNWTVPFDTTETFDGQFTLQNGSSVDCEYMYKFSEEDTTLRYYYNSLFRAATIPYGNEGFAMTVFLPREGKTVDDIIAEMNSANWADWMSGFFSIEFYLNMPKFKFDYEIKLNGILKAMGMEIAFNPGQCDLSGMFEDGTGWIDLVKHKAFVQVDESGTEAAAVTVVLIRDALPPTIDLNKPFLFVIHERESNTILFMGKVAEPVWQ